MKNKYNTDEERKEAIRIYQKEYSKKYRETNKEKVNEQIKNWKKANPEKAKESTKKDYKKNKAKIKERIKKYNDKNKKERDKKYRDNPENKEKIRKRVKKWQCENRKKINETQKKYRKKIPHIQAWRNILRNTLKRLHILKNNNTIDLLGYSAIDLKNHLTSIFTDGMSWDNYGEWHVDHIKMVSEFDKDTHPSIVNALSNLRPLWATTREINGVIYEGNLNRAKY